MLMFCAIAEHLMDNGTVSGDRQVLTPDGEYFTEELVSRRAFA
jgi:hypothetical protein